MKQMKVLIAEDEPIVTRYIKRLLEACGDFEVIAECESGEEALGRHDDTDTALGRGFAVFFRLQGDEVIADHAAGEVDLTDTVCEDFFFVAHFLIPFCK